MRAMQLPPLSSEEIAELDRLYRTTRDARMRTRTQMVLLAAERKMVAAEIAAIVRESEPTVRRWLKRYMAEGIEGLRDRPRPGGPAKTPPEYKERLMAAVRRRPRSLGLPYSLWTLQRLADYMAEATGIRVEAETVRRYLKAADIVLSRPQHKVSSPDPAYAVKKRRLKPPVTA